MTAPSASPQQVTLHVRELGDMGGNVRLVRLGHRGDDARPPLDFAAGQYAVLNFSQAGQVHETRPYSIASAPQQPYLEFHIRNTGRGVSAHAATALKPGDSVAVEGPFGKSPLVAGDSRPLVLLAGGVGIAPVKSIVDCALAQAGARPLQLYWGAADRGQLYLDDYFRGLAARHAHFAYHPVLLEGAAGPEYRQGYVGAALAADMPGGFAGHSFYLAGPTPMIDATLPLLLESGAQKDYIYSDAFQL